MKLKVYFPVYEGVLSSERWSRTFYHLADQRNFVIPVQVNADNIGNSFRVTAGSGLKVNVAEGYAFVGGHLVYESGGVSLDVPPSSTSYIYVEIQKDTNNRTTGASYLVSSNSNLESQNRMRIATVVTSSTAVTSVTDDRKHFLSNCIMPIKLETSTSTTLSYLNAKAVYLRVRALGGGGSGASTNTNNRIASGGAGGGFLQDDDLFIGGVQIQVQIGAGGASVSPNNAGANGGNTVITVRDANNNILKTYTAPFGRGGFLVTSATGSFFLTQQYNYEGVYYDYNLSIPSATANMTWMPASSGTTLYNSPFSAPTIASGGSQYTSSTRFFGGGNGGTLIVNDVGTRITYSEQTSALVWGGAGGASSTGAGSAGSAPAGGGGGGFTSSGAGANGAVRLELLVVY